MLKSYFQKNKIEVGCDEAGRGCLAGPVVAAAVILPKDFKHPLLNDSKQVSEKKRGQLKSIIEEHAIAYAIGIVSHLEIDELNILNASFLAMHRALDKINTKFDSILVDGNRFKQYYKTQHHCIIKGDAKYLNIAAASILAKTHRDAIMMKLDLDFPQYYWKKNKGYPTKKHRDAIREIGTNVNHRMSFRLLPDQLKLDL